MEAVKQNKQKQFEVWVNDFSDDLFSWALYKTSSRETAEDLVQETFLAAFHKMENFKGDSKPKTWLFSILKNKIVDYYRSNAKTNNQTHSLSESSGREITDDLFNENENWTNTEINNLWNNDEQELLDNPEFNKILLHCLDDLPSKWRNAFTSKYLTDKKAEEICQDLDISVTNYWQIVHRSKLLMKKCLEVKWL